MLRRARRRVGGPRGPGTRRRAHPGGVSGGTCPRPRACRPGVADGGGEDRAAEAHYRTALKLLEQAGATGDLADLCRLLGDLLRRTGDVEGALDIYRKGLGLRATPGTTTLGPSTLGP